MRWLHGKLKERVDLRCRLAALERKQTEPVELRPPMSLVIFQSSEQFLFVLLQR